MKITVQEYRCTPEFALTWPRYLSREEFLLDVKAPRRRDLPYPFGHVAKNKQPNVSVLIVAKGQEPMHSVVVEGATLKLYFTTSTSRFFRSRLKRNFALACDVEKALLAGGGSNIVPIGGGLSRHRWQDILC